MKKVIVSRGSKVDVEKCMRILGGNRYDAILRAAEHARQLAKNDVNTLASPVSALLDIQENGTNI